MTAACLANADWLQRPSCQGEVKCWLSDGHLSEIFIALKDLCRVQFLEVEELTWPHFI